MIPSLRVLLVMLALCAATGPAMAHAILIASTPSVNGSIPAGHRTLDFRYNSRIDRKRSRLTLTGSDGVPKKLAILANPHANVLDAEADLIPGSYIVRWQALALDGHITRGDVPFTATGPSGKP